jgi:hypothetical protein
MPEILTDYSIAQYPEIKFIRENLQSADFTKANAVIWQLTSL